jgi:hypothetical protein
MKTTAQLHGPIEKLRTFLLTQRKIVMKRIRCDQQFNTKPIKQLCETNGIVIEASPAHEKNYNGISERTNKTVQNMTFAMVKGAKLPIGYWGFSFTQSINIITAFRQGRWKDTGRHTPPGMGEISQRFDSFESSDVWP